MSYATEYIARTLKEARKKRGLSQRALSAKAGVPQGHISKIENGTVDLRLSSLIELARVLDLELALVPRKTVPAVQSVVRTSAASTLPAALAAQEVARIQNYLASISKVSQTTIDFAQLQRQVKKLTQFQLNNAAIASIREITKKMDALKGSSQAVNAIRNLNSDFERLRNALVHTTVNLPNESVRPAYSLDDEDDDA